MSGYLLDTSVIIDCLRGKKEVTLEVSKLEGPVCSSFVCLAELYEGVARDREPAELEKKTLSFFETFSIIFGLDEKIAREFGRIRKELKVRGNVIEDLDLLLAATCLANDLTLVTGNSKHFSRVRALAIKSP